ncbi:SAM-dependent methyltransferase [Tissierella carlieri]|jgi:SAM-dependent methyltransferase|uniref:class I SAM-dependent methyltransferase n=1 Tax=Tissierella TaxID=41273 RepID=UPI000BA0F69C|nr:MULTISPECIES: SAM-dependent methyltransferase [Tissierella]MBU5311725.1 SAM-dependent methyltransferase [Tissierella carlieri]MDU5080778.1 SAM-dependent methyltransferase [Bacillota bacterium]OZV11566.1 SAM-dependent methyltransferase [Tissierella sp. P1]
MNQVIKLLEEIIFSDEIIYGVLSNLRKKDEDCFNKVTIKPVLIREEIKLQFVYEYKNKVLHKNLDASEAIKEIENLLIQSFRQGVIFTREADYQILINKKGKASILKKKPTKEKADLSHNRKKSYIIEDGEAVDFLIRLGVMNEKGKVVSKRYDKFRQINRFLEMVADVISKIDKDKTLNIIDFGCGKSYLTFALYYYLVNILGLDVNIIGLDLKEDVINFCNEVAIDLNYDRLKFVYGDIKDYEAFSNVDMVVTLHACDIATDAALVKAVNWEAEAILSVPCCQHEIYDKIDNVTLEPMLKHGIIKEKLASLVTDSLRANVLEILGYQVQLLEFIDMEHTPKNILIRAVKNNDKDNKEYIDKYMKFKEFWGLRDLYIEKEFGERLESQLNK